MTATSSTRRVPAAVLWDMDGTLVDTEPYWLRAETELVEAWGGVWSAADGLQLVGSSLEGSARVLHSRGVDLPIADIIQVMTDRVLEQIRIELPWRPGARELLTEIRQAGIPTALVTMSIRRMADHIAESLSFTGFDVIVAGDEVENGKPDPEPYLRAAAALGVTADDCVVLEDSEFGVAAGVASGATTIAVPLHVPLPLSPAYTRWSTLEGRSLADLIDAAITRTT
ncbi:MAG TPA: HAD family phosphatase [Pseudolysinimonas sp.]|nr:HAD family phosphatase [Pseudolysinimonas sp.]